MRSVLVAVIAVFIMTGGAVTLRADVVTLTFDPNDLMDRVPSSITPLATQQDARWLEPALSSGYRWDLSSYHYITSSDYITSGGTQPKDYNTYLNWLDGLGPGEGLAMFNTGFMYGQDPSPNHKDAGEAIVMKPGESASGTAADGWQVRIINHPYGALTNVVQWYTTDEAQRLRPTANGGANIGLFTFTADLYWDNNNNGVWDAADPGVQPGETVRFWVGAANGDDANPPYWHEGTQAIIYDAAGWGTRAEAFAPSAAAYPSAGNGGYPCFEAMIDGTVVPEPAALGVLGLGLIGLMHRRRS